jgi:hypothetical protein
MNATEPELEDPMAKEAAYTDISLTDPTFDNGGDDGGGYTWLLVKLSLYLSPCGLMYYVCGLCECQFPAREFRLQAYRRHLVVQHLKFVGYKCHAVESAVVRSSEHRSHPALLRTCMTDSLVDSHQVASRILVDATAIGGTRKKHIFPYVEIMLVPEDRRLFVCGYCSFDTESLDGLKKHITKKHVTVKKAPIPDKLPRLERQGLTVFRAPPKPSQVD